MDWLGVNFSRQTFATGTTYISGLAFSLNLGFRARYDGIADTQNLIRRTLFPEAGRRTLAALPAPGTFPKRMAFVREVCRIFKFHDPLGHLQEAGCLAAQDVGMRSQTFVIILKTAYAHGSGSINML